jgi:hypothetical protein
VAGCGGGSGSAPKSVASRGSTTISATTGPKFSANPGSSWCGLIRSFKDDSNLPGSTTNTQAWVDAINSVLPQLDSTAPSAIKDDVRAVVAAFQAFTKALADDKYDFSQLTPVQASVVQDPKYKAASDRIDAYDTQVCGAA